jgi:HEAT repeat protein
MRLTAIDVLGQLVDEPDQVVPVLTDALHDPTNLVQIRAALGLGNFGPAAKTAVPALVKSLKGAGPNVGEWAAKALKAIDPEAAAKAGIPNSP